MALKRGWLKCWMSENAASVAWRSAELQQRCRPQKCSPGETCWCRESSAPTRRWSRGRAPRTGTPVLPGTQFQHAEALHVLASFMNCEVQEIIPPQCSPSKLYFRNEIEPQVYCSRFVFLFAGSVPCVSASEGVHVAGCLLCCKCREYLAGAWFAFTRDTCGFYFLQCCASFPSRSTERFSYLSRMADAPSKQITVGMQF